MEVAASYSPAPMSRLSVARSLTLGEGTGRLYSSYDEKAHRRDTNKDRKERFYDLLYIKSKTLHDRRGISRASVDQHPLPERVVDADGTTPTIPFSYVQSVHSAMHSFDPTVKRRRRGRLFAPPPVRSSDSPTNSSTTPSGTSSGSTYGPGRGGDTATALGALSPVGLSPTGSGPGDWLVRIDGGPGGDGGGGGGKGWTTENTTDRTSLSSSDWGDDVCEFDRQESRRVRVMFEQIEAMLFEASNTGPAHLYRECRHWVGRFPHLRLLGDQLVTPQDYGYSYHPMPSASESVPTVSTTSPQLPSPRHPPFAPTTSPDTDTMSLLGKRLEPNTPPSTSRLPARKSSQADRSSVPGKEEEEGGEEISVEEEVFAIDGVYEDMIAVDHRITEEDMTEKKYMKRRRHHGYPPLTPNAVLKDSIVNAVFDMQWAEIVSWMRPLMAENIHRMQGQQKDVDILPVLPLSPNQLPPFASARPEGPTRDISFIRYAGRPSPSNTPNLDETTLASLLQISIKTLQTRERSCLQDIPESPAGTMMAMGRTMPAAGGAQEVSRRPNSSVPRPHHRPGSVRQGDNVARVPSARGRGRGRLAPLDRSRTPFQEEESLLRSESVRPGLRRQHYNNHYNNHHPNHNHNHHLTVLPPPAGGLRGRSLQTGVGPDTAFLRSGTLPPLSMSSLGSSAPPAAKSQTMARIGSAVNHHSGGGGRSQHPAANAAHLLSQVSYPVAVATADNRPSTTHTFRSDTPFGRRSSTPLGLRAGVLLNLDIRGSSIGAGQHTHLEEAEEGAQIQPTHSTNWSSYPPPSHSVNNPYRRAKQLGYIVR